MGGCRPSRDSGRHDTVRHCLRACKAWQAEPEGLPGPSRWTAPARRTTSRSARVVLRAQIADLAFSLCVRRVEHRDGTSRRRCRSAGRASWACTRSARHRIVGPSQIGPQGALRQRWDLQGVRHAHRLARDAPLRLRRSRVPCGGGLRCQRRRANAGPLATRLVVGRVGWCAGACEDGRVHRTAAVAGGPGGTPSERRTADDGPPRRGLQNHGMGRRCDDAAYHVARHEPSVQRHRRW